MTNSNSSGSALFTVTGLISGSGNLTLTNSGVVADGLTIQGGITTTGNITINDNSTGTT